ncbi:hypothetical protein [Pseudoxanthomonas sp. SORGH_AS_0997]|uniref:hypothetical protein n=1 Tax=Pseudoxanthomonas sp. SORGH_AS_0997 TaxID=3041776 RepID=UPI00285C4256|nr:hypothetical protein [Pseudoxanthomonas sp. SORGH_AS_0997]MDR6139035.1 hypothetical protein [Pseudoxanthomonas sp. SORGH_AS_0997]
MNMKLKLEFPPTPEFAERHAANIVAATKDVDGTVLDYSLDSLHHVDRILQQMHDDGLPADRIPSTLFRFGCYIGEVALREHPAAWVDPARFVPESSLSFFPFHRAALPEPGHLGADQPGLPESGVGRAEERAFLVRGAAGLGAQTGVS